MLVPFESTPLPEVELREVPEYISQLKSGDLAGFVLHNVAIDGYSAMSTLEPDFAASGFNVVCKHDRDLGNLGADKVPFKIEAPDGALADRGLHIDQQHDTRIPATNIALHFTRFGAGISRFVELKASQPPHEIGWLEAAVFKADLLVDDQLANPVGNEATFRPGTAVVFRFYGQVPMAHDFRTTTFPRQSFKYNFSMSREKAAKYTSVAAQSESK